MQSPGTAVSLLRSRITFSSLVRANAFASVTPALRTPLLGLLVAISYYCGVQIGLLFKLPDTPLSAFCPANAILLAAFLLTPLRIWWVLVLALLPAHFLMHLRTSLPAFSVLGFFVGNVGQALLGAACIRPFQKEKEPLFASLRGVVAFLFFGVLLAPLLTSFLDAGFIVVANLSENYWTLWASRFTSNMIASLTVAPTIVTFVAGGIRKLWKARRTRFFEGAQLLAGTAVISFLVFGREDLFSHGPALICAPLPFLIWAAVRFGLAGLSSIMLEVTLISISCAWRGIGIFEYSSLPDSMSSLYILLALFELPVMLMAAVVTERRHREEALEQTLESTRVVLISTQEEERHHIARELHTDLAGRLALASISANEIRAGSRTFSEKLLLNKLRDEISGALEATLHLSAAIHPFGVEYLGLARAMRKLCLETATETGMLITSAAHDLPGDIPLGTALRIFRVAQLALQDVKERRAKTASVELRVGEGQILLRFTDDGSSMDVKPPQGAGLAYMRALLLSLGGTLTVSSLPTGGTIMQGSVPINGVPS